MAKSLAPEQELEAVRDQVRAEIREAREVLKDLRAEIKEARTLVPLLTDDLFEQEVRKQVAELGRVTEQAMDASVKRVIAKFDKLAKILMGEEHSQRSKPSIPEIIDGIARAKEQHNARP